MSFFRDRGDAPVNSVGPMAHGSLLSATSARRSIFLVLQMVFVAEFRR